MLNPKDNPLRLRVIHLNTVALLPSAKGRAGLGVSIKTIKYAHDPLPNKYRVVYELNRKLPYLVDNQTEKRLHGEFSRSPLAGFMLDNLFLGKGDLPVGFAPKHSIEAFANGLIKIYARIKPHAFYPDTRVTVSNTGELQINGITQSQVAITLSEEMRKYTTVMFNDFLTFALQDNNWRKQLSQ